MPIGRIKTLDDVDVSGKTVFVRVDINCPVDEETKKIVDDTRVRRTAPTLEELAEKGAKVVILAHQGDPLDFQNFAPLEEHAAYVAKAIGMPVDYIDDVVGPAARERIQGLDGGQLLLLENVRYHTEETIIFEKEANLSFEDQAKTTVVRKLAPLADLFVNDAFACVHRSEPTLCGFPMVTPSACGRLFEGELRTLTQVRDAPEKPCVFLLGGAKILDAFSMMRPVLERGSADKVLTQGLVGQIMLTAAGVDLGAANVEFIRSKGLDEFVEPAKELLGSFGAQIMMPSDLVVDRDGSATATAVVALGQGALAMDIGPETIAAYKAEIETAKTVFMNGPAGVYEKPEFSNGTRSIWTAVADGKAYSVIGGGDTIAASKKFGVEEKMSYICTAGGGLVLFMAGDKLPAMEALEQGK